MEPTHAAEVRASAPGLPWQRMSLQRAFRDADVARDGAAATARHLAPHTPPQTVHVLAADRADPTSHENDPRRQPGDEAAGRRAGGSRRTERARRRLGNDVATDSAHRHAPVPSDSPAVRYGWSVQLPHIGIEGEPLLAYDAAEVAGAQTWITPDCDERAVGPRADGRGGVESAESRRSAPGRPTSAGCRRCGRSDVASDGRRGGWCRRRCRRGWWCGGAWGCYRLRRR
jgi:hypothetical protein